MNTTKRIPVTRSEAFVLSMARTALGPRSRTESPMLVMAQDMMDCLVDGDLDGAIGYIAAHRDRIANGG